MSANPEGPVAPAPIQTVGVVGAGQMGQGIAQALLTAGLHVRLLDAQPGQVGKAQTAIADNLHRAVDRNKLTTALRDGALARLQCAPGYEGLASADLVIEAASEDVAIKQRIFAELDRVCDPDAILASNTSSISITLLAAAVKRPGRVIGMHFMNPVPIMKLVEIVRGLATSDATFDVVKAVALRMGKEPVVARDTPGFIVNRVLMPLVNEAVFALNEGTASAEDIDRACVLGLNHPLGPLALADLIGLDTVLAILEVLQRDFGDSKYRPCPLLRQYVAAGWLGRKTDRGFFRYPSG